MGRILVVAFLGGLALWAIAFVSLVLRLFWPSSYLDSIVLVSQSFLLGLIPALVLVALLIGLAVRRGRVEPKSWIPWMKWRDPRIVAVLTAYDDEESIPMAVREFLDEPCVKEVIVVDNNSHDRTALAATEVGARVVKEPNQGYGFACMRGLREALGNSEANIVALAEGDMTFSARDIHKMVPFLEDVEMVVGTRTTYELAAPDSQLDWFMSWGNLFLALLIRLRYWDSRFFGRIRLTDVGCTFRLLRREALEKIVNDLRVGGDYFSPHMILTALRHKLRIIEVPIRFRRRVGRSKGAGSGRRRATRIGFQMLKEIIGGS